MTLTVLRFVIAAAAIAVSVAAIRQAVIPRWECNAEKGRALAETSRQDERSTENIREILVLCRRCLEQVPNDYVYAFLLAANLHANGQTDDAERAYYHALEIRQRPETYARLAILNLERGDPEAAKRNLITAAEFDVRLARIVEGRLAADVTRAVEQRAQRLQQTDSAKR